MKALMKRFETVPTFFKKLRANIVKFWNELRRMFKKIHANGYEMFKAQTKFFFEHWIAASWKLYISWLLVFMFTSLISRSWTPIMQFFAFAVVSTTLSYGMQMYLINY